MPVVKIKAPSSPAVMKSGEGNTSVDTLVRQAIGREPFLSFSRATDSSVQWIQLLNALDQQAELPGWPLLSPLKVQIQKCDKCSREFCSPINYRRHMRVHHRLKKIDKDSTKNRELLGAFWDKLSVDDAKEIASLKNVALEEVPGSSVIKALTSLACKPGFTALPQVCLKAGSFLLDIIQGRHSRFPVSSQELFRILDDASEKTFLCGTAVAIQKYVFDGEAGKIALETKNVVACTSFMLEQSLVKAWLADKDAEALRCQKLLVEEEEAAQKRQAELLERKRKKRLKQKEQKAKEQKSEEKADEKECVIDILEAETPEETSSLSAACDTDRQLEGRQSVYGSLMYESPCLKSNGTADNHAQLGCTSGSIDSGMCADAERENVQGNGQWQGLVRWQMPPKTQWGLTNGSHATHGHLRSRLGLVQKHGKQRDARATGGNKVWSQKHRPVNETCFTKINPEKEAIDRTEKHKNCKVLIGSIPVSIGNGSSSLLESNNSTSDKDDGLAEQQTKRNNAQTKPIKSDFVQGVGNRLTLKLWRPVSRQETKGDLPVPCGYREPEGYMVSEKRDASDTSNESCLRSCRTDDSCGIRNDSMVLNGRMNSGSMPISSVAAKAFLAERCKEAIAADHIKLVLFPERKPTACLDPQNRCQVADNLATDFNKCSILGNVQNHFITPAIHEYSPTKVNKAKYMKKPNKGGTIKYIRKQRTVQ